MKRSQYVKQGAHLYPSHTNAEIFGTAKFLRQHPRRYTLLVREALSRLRLRWWERVTVWNEYYHPIYRGRPVAAGFQLLDFVVQIKGRGPLVILIKNPNSMGKPMEKLVWQAKLDLLQARSLPYLILPVHFTSQEYQVFISFSLRKKGTHEEVTQTSDR